MVIFWKWRKAKGISSFDGSAFARCWVSCSAHSRLDAMLGFGRLSFLREDSLPAGAQRGRAVLHVCGLGFSFWFLLAV